MKKYTPEELAEVLRLHKLWREDDPSGQRANLRGADLQGADLRGANLRGADLQRANLQGADLQGADLRGADLQGADLRGADLRGADLQRANLWGADLQRADLWGADLQRANLQGANLQGANLRGANLQGAKNAELALAQTSHIPAEGAFVAWKKCQEGVIVKLLIPEDAKRSHGTGRKCRASHVVVLDVIGAEEGISSFDPSVKYRKGETVSSDKWDEDRWNECSFGIHFFLHRLEAEAYSL